MEFPKTDSRVQVLIVAPPYRLSQTTFALGLMWIAAVLQKAGHHVEVIDMDVLNLNEEELTRQLRERTYDYLCLGGMITAWNFARFVCDYVKAIKPHVTVVVGGGIITSTPLSFLSVARADIGVIGEGEEAILDIINTIEYKKDLAGVPGIVYRRDGQLYQTGRREPIQDLDTIPFPAWDLFNVRECYSRYPSHRSVLKAKRLGSIYTTRGCPFQCTFCYTEKKVRQRSIPNVIEEIKELYERYGIRHLMIADDLFVVRKERAIEFCEALIRERIKITWSATGRCNIIDREFLKIMKAGGCDFMGLGIESGSADVLKAMKKNQTPQQIIEAVKMVQDAGIIPGGTFILGMPGETRQTIRETVSLYKEINKYRKHVNRFFFATPYPGTPLYAQMRKKGKIPDEIAFFELLSERGDAVDFVTNCTDSLSDTELIEMKKEIEAEVFHDFVKKHPLAAFCQFMATKTYWSEIQSTLIFFKMRGFVAGFLFLWKKLLTKLGWIPNPYTKRWAMKRASNSSENLLEGKNLTF